MNNLLEVFLACVAGNFVFYMGVRTYYRIQRSLQERAFQQLLKSGQVKMVSMDQLQNLAAKEEEKKSWN